MMTAVQLFAVEAGGPRQLSPAVAPTGIHDLPAGLPYGVYTAMRTFEHNRFLELAAHLDRLEQSAALLGWSYRLDRQRLRRALHTVCSAYPGADARVRIDILAGPATLLGSTSRELITLAPFTPLPVHLYREGVRVALAPALQRKAPLVKHADFVLERSAYPLGEPDAYEYLLLDDGRILEGSSSNFYGVFDGELWTAGDGVLAGIARQIVLRLAAELVIPLRLEAVPLAAVPELAEAFLTSASRGVLPVVAIGDEPVGPARPGAVTRRLSAAYDDYVERAIEPAL
ncbi:MAG: aminotransferase class IV [Anaerolineae bacterium]|nr:aminotransferase class IV [Anaerolineae bacterium]